MAMTKESCIAEGEQLFRQGAERPEGDSWQAKARQQGYDCAQTDADDEKFYAKKEQSDDTQVEVIRVSNQVAQVLQKAGEGAILDYLKDYAARVRPALHHASFLEKDAIAEKNPKRSNRLMLKAKAIRLRYSIA